MSNCSAGEDTRAARTLSDATGEVGSGFDVASLEPAEPLPPIPPPSPPPAPLLPALPLSPGLRPVSSASELRALVADRGEAYVPIEEVQRAVVATAAREASDAFAP